jgi:hypothetical protein
MQPSKGCSPDGRDVASSRQYHSRCTSGSERMLPAGLELCFTFPFYLSFVCVSHTFFVSHPISRSRKRSCQACTGLKVKCDLRQPCSKCRARGRDCVYTTEEGQKESASGPSNLQQTPDSCIPLPIFRLEASRGFDPFVLGRDTADAFAATFPELSLIEETSNAISNPLSEANLASFGGGAPRIRQSAMSLPTIDASTDITTSSFCIGGPKHAFPAVGGSDVTGHSRRLHDFSPTMFEPFFRDVFSVKEEPSQEDEQGVGPLLHAPDAGTLVDALGQPDFTQSFPIGTQSLDANLDGVLVSTLMSNFHYDNTQVPHLVREPLQVPTSSCSAAPLSVPPPNPPPILPINSGYDYSKPPVYTQQDSGPSLPPARPMTVSPPDPSAEELQYYCGFVIHSVYLYYPLSYSLRLLDHVSPSNSHHTYPDGAFRG